MHEQKPTKTDFERFISGAPVLGWRSWGAASLSLGGALLSLFALGCPQAGDLDNPGQYSTPPGSTATAGSGGGGGGSAGGSGGGGGAAASCDSACATAIFTGTALLLPCKTCHSAKSMADGGLQSSGLDLESPNVGARLKGAMAKHMDILDTSPKDCATGDLLIDPANPANSWLLKKVAGPVTCGDRMPSPTMPLTADQIACISTFVNCVAGK